MDTLDLNVDFNLNEPVVAAATKRVKDNIAGVGATAQTAAAEVAKSTQNIALAQMGMLERAKNKLKEFQDQASAAKNITALEKANIQAQAFEREIVRLNNIGKQGFDDLGNKLKDAAERPVGAWNRLKHAADLYKNAAQTATNPELITKYNKKFEETELQLNRVKNSGKKGFDDLGNAISKNTNLASKSFSVLRNISYILPGIGIAGILGFLSTPILEYVASLGLFKAKIDTIVKTRKELSDTMLKGSQNAQKELVDVKLLYGQYTNSNIPIKQRKEAYDQIQKLYPAYFGNMAFEETASNKTKAAYDNLTTSILATARARAASDKIAENSGRQLEDEQKITDLKTDALKLQKDLAKAKLLENQQNNGTSSLNGGAGSITGAQKVYDIQSKIADNLKLQNNLKTDSEILNQRNLSLEKEVTKEIAKGGKLTGSAGGKDTKKEEIAAENQFQSALAKRAGILEKIDAVKAESVRKSKSHDDEEIDANTQKFAQLRNELVAYNKWATNYNKTHKAKPVDLVDLNQIEPIRKNAEANLIAKQTLERTKVEIDEQKGLYREYETYKTEYGQQEANRRYAGQIGKAKSYIDYLKSLAPSDSDTSAYANALRDYLAKELPKAKNEAFKQEFVDNIRNLKSVEDATKNSASLRAEIERQYDKELQTLALNREKYTDEEYALRLQKLAENKAQQLVEVRDLAFKETAYYRDAIMSVTDLSLKELKNRIREAKKELAKADLTPDQRAAANEKINTAESGLSALGFSQDQYGQDIRAYSAIAEKADKVAAYSQAVQSSFNELAAAISPFNEGLGDTLGTIGDIAGIAGNAAKSVASFATGDIVGGITGAISAIAGVFSIGAKSRESARKAQAELAQYQDNLVKGEISYNQLLRERERTLKNISELSLTELQTRQKIYDTQKSQAQQDYNRLLQIIQLSGKQVTNEYTEKYGGFLGIGRKTRTVQETSGVAGSSFAQLEELYTKGALTDSTKTWFEELRKVKNELDTIGDSTDEVFAQINQTATGTTASSIASAIIEGFKQGKRAPEEFADNFKSLMTDAMFSVFQSNFLNERIDAFYKEFASASAGGLTGDKINALRASYAKIISDSAGELSNLEQVIGIDLGNGSQNSPTKTVANAVKGITADQADLLAGQVGGLRLAQLETNIILRANQLSISEQIGLMRDKLLLLFKIEANTKITADVIQSVDKSLQSMDKKMTNNGGILAANGKGG